MNCYNRKFAAPKKDNTLRITFDNNDTLNSALKDNSTFNIILRTITKFQSYLNGLYHICQINISYKTAAQNT